ncbi:hypothetical protein AVEN_75015-1, partial [Araneus ventricosus]
YVWALTDSWQPLFSDPVRHCIAERKKLTAGSPPVRSIGIERCWGLGVPLSSGYNRDDYVIPHCLDRSGFTY